jgi:hypothetical protein
VCLLADLDREDKRMNELREERAYRDEEAAKE